MLFQHNINSNKPLDLGGENKTIKIIRNTIFLEPPDTFEVAKIIHPLKNKAGGVDNTSRFIYFCRVLFLFQALY